MCVKTLDIYNKAKKFSYRGFSLINSVPCGVCPECQQRKSNDYLVRSYFEWKNCISQGGFAYFDTLTYNNSHLPRHYGINHFSKSDIVSFFKKLRVYLSRRKFRTDFKYFVSAEYGGLKHRPHYHLLIYNYDPRLSVARLWYLIHKAWRTNGYTDTRSKAPARVLNSSAALTYVAKYVQKDQEYQKVVDQRIEKLNRIGRADAILSHIDDFKPFHLQSNGLGDCVLKFVSIHEIFDKGVLFLPDKKYLWKKYSIPQYNNRKMFYYYDRNPVLDEVGNHVLDDKGRKKYEITWHLTELGKQFKKSQLEKVIDSKVDYYLRIYDNLSQYNVKNFDVSAVRSLLDSYLGNRSLRDFAAYLVVYRGKTLGLTDPCPSDYKAFFDFCLEVPKEKDSKLYSDDLSERSSARSFLSRFKIDQYSFQCFAHFDDLFNLFQYINQNFQKKVADYDEESDSVCDRLKLII